MYIVGSDSFSPLGRVPATVFVTHHGERLEAEASINPPEAPKTIITFGLFSKSML